jgi:hypothetical protein
MDVLCVGMYRACSTWQYDIVADLVEQHHGGCRIGYLTGEEYARIGTSDGWRVLKSHEEHPSFTAAIKRGRAIAIYAYRDLRDVVYSMLHKRGVSFANFLRQGMIHQVLANDRYWMARPRGRVLVQRYEDLIADSESGITALARFLGVEIGHEDRSQLARENSLESNRLRLIALRRDLEAQGWNPSDPSNLQRYDGHSLLHWNHLREGRAGDWHSLANAREREILSRIVGSWLIERGYERDRNWAAATPHSGLLGRTTPYRRELAMARGWLTCRLRCETLRHPNLAKVVKRVLGIDSAPPPAAPLPAALTKHQKSDASLPHPHLSKIHQPAQKRG